MLTETELDNILNWAPYRTDWKIDRNANDDLTNNYIKKLITDFSENQHFKLLVTHDGGMSNYLEFICYPAIQETYSGIAIIVLISLCAPIATYGQTVFYIDNKSMSYNYLEPEGVEVITSPGLLKIANEVKNILNISAITILDKKYLSKQLPTEKIGWNDCLLGDQYLHGIFQISD